MVMYKSSKKQRISPVQKWLREPLIHFFVLGLVVFGLYGAIEREKEPVGDPFLVEVSSAEIEWYRTMWSKRMGRQPTIEELRGQVNQLIREQVLSREALSMGLDDGDTVVRRRLAQKMDFMFKNLSSIPDPTDEVLQAYLRDNLSTYEIPGRITFTHIYFNTDKRGEEGAEKAVRQLLVKLNAGKSAPRDVSGLGDPFLLQSRYSNKTMPEIRREFGRGFAEDIQDQVIHTWQGPVRSGYGMHAVRVEARLDAELPEFIELEEALKSDWMVERQRELAGETYEKLRKRYQVLVEGMPYNLDIEG
jgi:peptidyl-prolyl cis-trans isomerase C